MEQLLTTAQVADRLDVTKRRVAQLCAEGKIGRKIPGLRNWLFTEQEIEEFLETEYWKGRRPGNPRSADQPRDDLGQWVTPTPPEDQ